MCMCVCAAKHLSTSLLLWQSFCLSTCTCVYKESQNTSHEWRDEMAAWWRLCCGLEVTLRVFLVCSWTYKCKRSVETRMITPSRNNGHEVDRPSAGVPHVDASVEAVICCSQANCTWRQIPRWSQGQYLCEGFEKQLQQIIHGHIHAQTYHKDIGHAHELAPQCAWTYSWAECWHGVYLCGLPTERPRMGYPCSRSLSFKAHDHGLALQAAFQHLFNLGLLSPSFLGSPIESSRFASLASLLGSEKNDNHEAWRLSTASHTNIHTLMPGTDDTANADTHSLTHSVL